MPPPPRDPTTEAARLAAVLQEIWATGSKNQVMYASMVDSLKEMANPLGSAAKIMHDMKESVMDITEEIDDGIESYKALNRLSRQFGRLSGDSAKANADTVKALEEMKRGYEKILEFKRGDAKATADITALLGKVQAALNAAGTAGADLSAELSDIRQTVIDIGEAARNIEFSKPISKVGMLGESIGTALKGLKQLDDYGFKGFFGKIEAMRNRLSSLKEEARKGNETRLNEMVRKGQGKFFGNQEDVKNLMSWEKDKRNQGVQSLAKKFSDLSDPKEKGEMLRMMSGRTGFGGAFDRFLTGRALSAAGGGAPMGMVGKAGFMLMGAGGGSVLGGALSKLSGPLQAITAVLQFLQMGADKNKDIYSALGKGGLISGDQSVRDAYQGWGSRLTPSANPFSSFQGGTAAFYGMDFSKSLDVMKEVVESGQNVAGLHKNRSVDDVLRGGRATDIYSGVMRNAAIFGKPIGLSETESAQTTMKFMHDFNLSMGEIEDMFVHITSATKVAGLTTTKYLNLIDSVTGQFDKMNKSLGFTAALLVTLGRNAKYTAEDLQGMVKGLMGERKDLVLSAFAYQQMGGAGTANLDRAQQAKATRSASEVEKRLNVKNAEGMTELELRRAIPANDKDATALVERYIAERSVARAGKGRDALGRAAVDMTAGAGPEREIVKNLAMIETTFQQAGGSIMDLLGGSKEAESRKYQMMASPLVAELSKVLGTDIQSTMKYMGGALTQIADEMQVAAGEGPEAREAQGKLGLTEDQIAALKEQTRGGKKAEQTDVFRMFIKESGIAGMATIITEQMRKDADDKAQQNQRFITGPMDYLKRVLTAMADNVAFIAQTLFDFVNWSMFGETEQEIREKNKESAKGFENNGQTQARLESNVATLQKFASPEDRKRIEAMPEATLEQQKAKKKALAAQSLMERYARAGKEVGGVFFDPENRDKISNDTREGIKGFLESTNDFAELIEKRYKENKEAMQGKGTKEAVARWAKWKERLDTIQAMPAGVDKDKQMKDFQASAEAANVADVKSRTATTLQTKMKSGQTMQQALEYGSGDARGIASVAGQINAAAAEVAERNKNAAQASPITQGAASGQRVAEVQRQVDTSAASQPKAPPTATTTSGVGAPGAGGAAGANAAAQAAAAKQDDKKPVVVEVKGGDNITIGTKAAGGSNAVSKLTTDSGEKAKDVGSDPVKVGG